MWLLYIRGVWGPPAETFEKLTLLPCILRLMGSPRVVGGVGRGVIIFPQHIWMQICTDLKNGPNEFQKAWKTEKPERGWALVTYIKSIFNSILRDRLGIFSCPFNSFRRKLENKEWLLSGDPNEFSAITPEYLENSQINVNVQIKIALSQDKMCILIKMLVKKPLGIRFRRQNWLSIAHTDRQTLMLYCVCKKMSSNVTVGLYCNTIECWCHQVNRKAKQLSKKIINCSHVVETTFTSTWAL